MADDDSRPWQPTVAANFVRRITLAAGKNLYARLESAWADQNRTFPASLIMSLQSPNAAGPREVARVCTNVGMFFLSACSHLGR
jgi:hypothetical protein